MKNAVLASMILFTSIARSNSSPVLDSLARGWPQSYQSILRDLKADRSYLLLHIELPKAYIDLRSAEHLRSSLLATPPWDLKDDRMGHIAFGWKCSNSRSPWKFGFTSQSGDYSHQTMDMIANGWGLAGLASEFTDGVLLTPQQNEDTHIKGPLYGSDLKMIHFLLEVSDSDCENVIQYMRSYTEPTAEKPFPAYGSYGLTLSPEKLEGGACNSLAITALDAGNFFGPGTGAKMYRSFGLPNSMTGRPKELKAQYAIPFVNADVAVGNEVHYKKLLNEEWTYNGQGPIVQMADTELLVLFLKSAYEEALQSSGANVWKKFRALYPLQRRMYSRVSNSSIHEQNGIVAQNIDESFDSQARQISLSAKSWYKSLTDQGLVLKRVPWGTQIGFQFTKP